MLSWLGRMLRVPVGNPFLYGQESEAGRAAQPWVQCFPEGLFAAAFLCPSQPPGAGAWAVHLCFSRVHSLGHRWIPMCSPPCSLLGCHPPSGSRAVQLSCDFVWEQSMGPQLFWSRVEVVMSLAHHLGIPLTAACLKEVGIQHPYDGCTIVTLAIGQMAPGLVCPAVGMHL